MSASCSWRHSAMPRGRRAGSTSSSEAKLLGASADVVDRPTGDRKSSATVWMMKTTARNHHGDRSFPPGQIWSFRHASGSRQDAGAPRGDTAGGGVGGAPLGSCRRAPSSRRTGALPENAASPVAQRRAPSRRVGVFLGRSRWCCTLERGATVGGFRVFRMIPGFFLECRFPVGELPCAEGSALHMGGFQRC